MDYSTWAAEYQTEAAQIKARVNQLRQAVKTANCNETNELHRRIAVLYAMYLELRDVGNTLATHPQTLREQTKKEERHAS